MSSTSYSYNTVSKTTSFGLISLILAIAAALVIYFVFMDKKASKKYTGFLKGLYEYLHFNLFFIEPILKISYIAVAIYITLISFNLISTSFYLFLAVLIGGNVIARIFFELIMVTYKICINVIEINKKMK
jgi:hypothetical protein